MSRLLSAVAILALALTTACRATRSYGTGPVGMHPPAPAPGQVVQPWEHFCVHAGGDLDAILDEAGRGGWELVTIYEYNLVCFKRPLTLAAPAEASPAAMTPSAP